MGLGCFFVLFLRWIDFGGWSVESVLNVAIVQVLPVSKFNFQLGLFQLALLVRLIWLIILFNFLKCFSVFFLLLH